MIELVVAVAIIGILISIAIPAFTDLQYDARISQLKNALATIIKECSVAQLRGKSTRFADISAAKASVPGYRLKAYGHYQGTPQYDSSNCFASVQWPAGTPQQPGIIVAAEPTQVVAGQAGGNIPKTPTFMIIFKTLSGEVVRYCDYVNEDPVFKGGCVADAVIPTINLAVGSW